MQLQLLDLNEGKILELGEFYYAGNTIFIKNAINTIPQQYNSKNENGSPIVCLMGEECFKTPLSQSTHTKLIPILEKTRAELFGDRYVLMEKGAGDVIQRTFRADFTNYSPDLKEELPNPIVPIKRYFYLNSKDNKDEDKAEIVFKYDLVRYSENPCREGCECKRLHYNNVDLITKEDFNEEEHEDNRKTIGNLIFEYPLLLKREPNKFEKFCELVG